MHLRREGRRYLPLLYLHSLSLTDRWGLVDEVSPGVSSSESGWEGCVSLFPFSAPLHRVGGQASLCLSFNGGGRCGRSRHSWQRCMPDDGMMTHSAPVKSAAKPAASIPGDEDRLLPRLPWTMGSRGHAFCCSLVPWKINSLLELHGHQRRNEIAIKWRQSMFTFVRYDYGCFVVSVLLLWRNFSGSFPPSSAVPALLLLFIWTSSPPSSLDTSLPGCWFYFCPLPRAIQSAYCVCTDARHLPDTHCKILQHGFYVLQKMSWSIGESFTLTCRLSWT